MSIKFAKTRFTVMLSVFVILVMGFFVRASLSFPVTRSMIFEYNVIINNIPDYVSNLRVWIPEPQEEDNQLVENIAMDLPEKAVITEDKIYNNKMVYYSIDNFHGDSLNLTLKYKVTRKEIAKKDFPRFYENSVKNNERFEKYLMPNNLVTISPRIKDMADKITEGKYGAIEKARAIYDYVFSNVEYDKNEPGWGRGDTERVCDVKKGNCTDFHSLFISLARASGIPARFLIGVPVPSGGESSFKNYHCWAEFYVDGYGWVPVDISEAWKDKTKYDYFFGSLDKNRIELSRGRDIVLNPSQNSEPLNYFFYPYVEIDGKKYDNVDLVFKVSDIKGNN